MTNQSIALVTDSTCDVPGDLLEYYGIFTVPQVIVWGGKEYLDRVDLQPEEFYRRMAAGDEIPTTAVASPHDFSQIYQKAKKMGARKILVFSVSSVLSGIYQAACIAAEEVEIPVTVIDSKGTSMFMGWQVLAAARELERGGDLDSMVKKAAEVRKSVMLSVCLDTVRYVAKGGRLREAAKWMGTLLQIKLLITINHQNGCVDILGTARTYRKGIDLMKEKFLEKMTGHSKYHVAVLHGDAPEEVAPLQQWVSSEVKPLELLTNITCPAIGINTGPHALGLCGYAEE